MRLAKKFRWLLLAMLLLSGAGWLYWAGALPEPKQIITLPDGSRFRFAGATWGTNAVPPYWAAHVIRRVPSVVSNYMAKYLGQALSGPTINFFQRENNCDPQMFLWFVSLSTNTPGSAAWSVYSSTAVLADGAGMKSGAVGKPLLFNRVRWSYLTFPLVPRRNRTVECDLYASSSDTKPFATIHFRNPVYGWFRRWKAEPLPAIKRAGDLEVRLDEIDSGVPDNQFVLHANGSREVRYASLVNGIGTHTGFDYSLRSPRGTNEFWVLHHAELSDPTGNRLDGLNQHDFMPDHPQGYFESPTSAGWLPRSEWLADALWPDEPAWRLKLQFKRIFGYSGGEVTTFSNVLVWGGGTNGLQLTNRLGNSKVIFMWRTSQAITYGGSGYFDLHVRLEPRLQGVAIDLLNFELNGREQVNCFRQLQGDSSLEITFGEVPADVKLMNFKFLVQKTRSVEFLVKPSHGGKEWPN